MCNCLESEPTCLRKPCWSCTKRRHMQRKAQMLRSEQRLRWCHRMQRGASIAMNTSNHCVLILKAVWPASAQKSLIVADGFVVCHLICHITSHVVLIRRLRDQVIVPSLYIFTVNSLLTVVCFLLFPLHLVALKKIFAYFYLLFAPVGM